jgi:hypothetical protein
MTIEDGMMDFGEPKLIALRAVNNHVWYVRMDAITAVIEDPDGLHWVDLIENRVEIDSESVHEILSALGVINPDFVEIVEEEES